MTWKIIIPYPSPAQPQSACIATAHSSELVDLDTLLWYVLQVQRLIPLTGSMVVVAFHDCFGLLKTNVIETGERGPVYVPYRVVRDEEMFFPAHKNEIAIR